MVVCGRNDTDSVSIEDLFNLQYVCIGVCYIIYNVCIYCTSMYSGAGNLYI